MAPSHLSPQQRFDGVLEVVGNGDYSPLTYPKHYLCRGRGWERRLFPLYISPRNSCGRGCHHHATGSCDYKGFPEDQRIIIAIPRYFQDDATGSSEYKGFSEEDKGRIISIPNYFHDAINAAVETVERGQQQGNDKPEGVWRLRAGAHQQSPEEPKVHRLAVFLLNQKRTVGSTNVPWYEGTRRKQASTMARHSRRWATSRGSESCWRQYVNSIGAS